jgi:DNA-binding NtrC family response regulator
MAFRLVATIDNRCQRDPLPIGESLLGSHPDCELRLAHATVSRRHARVLVTDSEITFEDLGSRNGIWRADERVTRTTLRSGEKLRIGAVPVVIEELPDHDLEAEVVLDQASQIPTGPQTGAGNRTTYESGPAERFVTDALPRLLDRVSDGASQELTAQLVGETLLELLPCTEVELSHCGSTEAGVLFTARRGDTADTQTFTAAARAGHIELKLLLPSPALAEGAAPLLSAAAAIIRMAGEQAEALSPPYPTQPPPLPDPPSVDPQMRSIYTDTARVARGDIGVLILGESGTAKEVLARYLHSASPRAEAPFFSLDCAALPKDLLEAELFGIEKGVATGVDERPGKFELANGGTLFLDEIGDMAEETQAKLLRILQSGECHRIGARRPRPVDVRIVAATNRDLKGMLSQGGFRNDLYHRIATWVVELPPLRHRQADIANLAAHFLAREARRRGLKVHGISKAAVQALQSYSWPGNIRQLENEMARAVLFLEDGELLDTGRLGSDICHPQSNGAAGGSLRQVLDATERREISAAIGSCDDDVGSAARRLGISRATLYRRMKALGIRSSGD